MNANWFDSHLDLAYLAACGRDMRSPDLASCRGPDLPAAVSLPSLRAGGITQVLGTIFTEADGSQQPISYPMGDTDAAHAAGVRQLAIYHEWAAADHITLHLPGGKSKGRGPIGVRILMECADPIRDPDELPWWMERGVAAIGLAWVKPGRYAGGNATSRGLTDLGRALVRAMDALGVVHDASHLSDRSLSELFEGTQRPVIASHSNSRVILTSSPAANAGVPPGMSTDPDVPPFQRQLTDTAIREISRRDGVIGLNLFSPFLIPGGTRDRRATIGEAVRHIEHVCEIAGNRSHVGLGSDMDGGFSALSLPEGIERPDHLTTLSGALRDKGWSAPAVAGFQSGNWERFWSQVSVAPLQN